MAKHSLGGVRNIRVALTFRWMWFATPAWLSNFGLSSQDFHREMQVSQVIVFALYDCLLTGYLQFMWFTSSSVLPPPHSKCKLNWSCSLSPNSRSPCPYTSHRLKTESSIAQGWEHRVRVWSIFVSHLHCPCLRTAGAHVIPWEVWEHLWWT